MDTKLSTFFSRISGFFLLVIGMLVSSPALAARGGGGAIGTAFRSGVGTMLDDVIALLTGDVVFYAGIIMIIVVLIKAATGENPKEDIKKALVIAALVGLVTVAPTMFTTYFTANGAII